MEVISAWAGYANVQSRFRLSGADGGASQRGYSTSKVINPEPLRDGVNTLATQAPGCPLWPSQSILSLLKAAPFPPLVTRSPVPTQQLYPPDRWNTRHTGVTHHLGKTKMQPDRSSFEKKVIDVHGERGADWLSRLADTIAKCERRWSIKVMHPFAPLSYNYVAQPSVRMAQKWY